MKLFFKTPYYYNRLFLKHNGGIDEKGIINFFSAVVVIALLFPSTYFNAEENNEAKEGRNISEENIKEDDVQVNDKKDVGNINVEVNDNDEEQVKDDEGTNEEEKMKKREIKSKMRN